MNDRKIIWNLQWMKFSGDSVQLAANDLEIVQILIEKNEEIYSFYSLCL